MASLRYTNSFLAGLLTVDGKSEDEAWRKLELVESVPGVGTAVSDSYLIRLFGDNCLKVAARSFDVIYRRMRAEHEGDDEIVEVLGIIHQRSIR